MLCAGHNGDQSTLEADAIAPVLAAMILWARRQGIQVLVEQPCGSLLPTLTHYRCALFGMRRIATHGCMFGFDSKKTFWLFLTEGLRAKFFRRRCQHGLHPRPLTKRSGRWVSATSAMPESSTYTRAFAQAIIRAWAS